MNEKVRKFRDKNAKRVCKHRKCSCGCRDSYIEGFNDMWVMIKPLIKSLEKFEIEI